MMNDALTAGLIDEITTHVEDGTWPVTAAASPRLDPSLRSVVRARAPRSTTRKSRPTSDDLSEYEGLCYLLVRRIARPKPNAEAAGSPTGPTPT